MVTSGGLDTVGIRMPSHKVARALISACGFPIAAPSANLSGSPSPTTAQHVLNDMHGRIPAIIDGGACGVGVESTVISFEGEDGIRLLRPGFISAEDLMEITPNVLIDKGVLEKLGENVKVRSPGMKYKHYAPKADVTIIDSSLEAFREYVKLTLTMIPLLWCSLTTIARGLISLISAMAQMTRNRQKSFSTFSESLTI